MAKRTGLILTWKPYGNAKGGRWSKVIDGRRRYFGNAPTKSDRDAYKAAVAAYRKFMDERDAEVAKRTEIERLQDEFEATGRDPRWAAAVLMMQEARERVQSEQEQAIIAKAQELLGYAGPNGSPKTIPALVDAYVAEQKRRYQMTVKQPEALPAKRRLTVSSFKSIKDQTKVFKNWAEAQGRVKTFGDLAQTESIFKRYHEWLEKQVLNGSVAPATATNRLQRLRPFIKWLWQNRHIEDMPRNIDDAVRGFTHKPAAKAISVADIHKLWKHADDRMRCIIALCLNAGQYPREVAHIRNEHIKDGYLAKRRPKTGVAGKWKLWPVTKALINRTRQSNKPNDYLWTTRRGKPLIHDTPNARSDALAQPWRDLCKKAGVDAKFAQLRDTAATEIEKIGKRLGNPHLVSQMLSQADGRTARFYIDASMEPFDLQTDLLDQAIDELEAVFSLNAGANGGQAEKAA